eukprot:scaffold101_cov123-Cylindrotheca_fusiformis.AAC.13
MVAKEFPTLNAPTTSRQKKNNCSKTAYEQFHRSTSIYLGRNFWSSASACLRQSCGTTQWVTEAIFARGDLVL